MGKTIDLPDPLDKAAPLPAPSADELLAQLAGDEIDRLLAEADSAQPAVSRAPFHVGPPPTPAPQAQPEVAAAEALPPAAAEPPRPSPVEMDVAAEMDALFSAATAKDEAEAAAVAQATAEAEAETSAAERDGLKAPAVIAGAPVARVQAAPADDDTPLPLYLRPLEWLNAPLLLLPEAARDIVGKIAIVTLINAAVILAYVLIVRR